MRASRPGFRQPFISLADAAFRLGDRLVFENLSWVFHRDEQWAIIGANGSGKSLLADGIRGRLPLVRGELHYHFRPPAGLSPEEAIGHVAFEDRKSDTHGTVVQSRWNSIEEESSLRVRDFLSYERVMEINPFEVTDRHEKARPAFERRRRSAAALLHIEPFLDRTLISLSNGETQRVRLARALCHPQRLLILDEPFAGLDAASRKHVREVLERLMGTSLRVLLITTRLEDLPDQVTHVLRVDGCRVVAAGRRVQILPGEQSRVLARRERGRKGPASNVSNRGASALRGDPKSPTLVRLSNVTVRYGEGTILRDLNWTIRAGQSWALVGPNGSGKTTVLSLILGDNPQVYANNVEVFGKQSGTGETVWEIRRRIGWVSPELQVHFSDTATCFEVAASGFHGTIGLFQRLTAHQRMATRRCLGRFGMQGYADIPLFELSTGQQRMVLLARALVNKPPLLLLDEPCQGLDAEHRTLFVRMVDKLIRAGSMAVVYVTHRDDELPPSIKRVFRLSDGEGTADWRRPYEATKKPAAGCRGQK